MQMILPCGVTQCAAADGKAQSAMLLLTDMLVFGAVHMLRGADVIYQGARMLSALVSSSPLDLWAVARAVSAPAHC